ncbi:MAG: YraN family protein [Candidatus Pacebacteria bacterium]|nr:YraN family protein [Candidatus Paceibacterota bacterium]
MGKRPQIKPKKKLLKILSQKQKKKKLKKNQTKNPIKKNLTKNLSEVGRQTEQLAAQFLEQNGYQILERNFRYRQQEIDLIALDQTVDEIVFIEVKYRQNSEFGHPSQAVGFNKLKNIKLAARAYLTQINRLNNRSEGQLSGKNPMSSQQMNKDYRFDIISILPGKIDHLINISWQI